MRKASVKRKTAETEISAALNIDGSGKYKVETPMVFLTHMLATFSRAGAFDLTAKVLGDMEVDQHHTVEDTGLVLGEAFRKALGKIKGIERAGFFVYPMDEALAVVAVDLGGRPFLQFDAEFRRRFCGDFDTDTLEDFFFGFASGVSGNIVVRMPYGRSDHHKIEAIFKAFGKAMKMACSKDSRLKGMVPSVKGIIGRWKK